MSALRSTWDMLLPPMRTTIFQDFHWNLLALSMFAGREEPMVVCARASHGTAIVPAVVRRADSTLRLLGEELFDYRTFLHLGDGDTLNAALGVLAERRMPFEATAMREWDVREPSRKLEKVPLSAAPAVLVWDVSYEDFVTAHGAMGRNARRLDRLAFQLRRYDGAH